MPKEILAHETIPGSAGGWRVYKRFTVDQTKYLRADLVEVDVESLYCDALTALDNPDDWCKGFQKGYNQAINNLLEQGIIHAKT